MFRLLQAVKADEGRENEKDTTFKIFGTMNGT
jgi:hypothetical protein